MAGRSLGQIVTVPTITSSRTATRTSVDVARPSTTDASRVKAVTEPPMPSRNLRAGSSVSSATTAPIANRMIDEMMNGTAYFFSVGLSPGVMKRQSCHNHTGSARTMPP